MSDVSDHLDVTRNVFTNYAQDSPVPGVMLYAAREATIVGNDFDVQPQNEGYAVVVNATSWNVQLADNRLLYRPRFATPFVNLAQ